MQLKEMDSYAIEYTRLVPGNSEGITPTIVHESAEVAKWSVDEVARVAQEELKLDDDDVEKLRSHDVDGSTLLFLDKEDMPCIDLSLPAEASLLSFIRTARHGGEWYIL